MEIIKLSSQIIRERKEKRSKNLKKNKGAYAKLKQMLVPTEMSLSTFRRYYHPVLTTKEKEELIELGIDPWSVDGLKYHGDSKRKKAKK